MMMQAAVAKAAKWLRHSSPAEVEAMLHNKRREGMICLDHRYSHVALVMAMSGLCKQNAVVQHCCALQEGQTVFARAARHGAATEAGSLAAS